MPISPQKAHERAKKAAAGRKNPDYLIRTLAVAELTAEQKRKIAALLMPFLDADEQVGGVAAGDAA
jgi:hypothetical protein